MKKIINEWKKYVMEEQQLEEVSFTAFNFPYDGNEDHKGAGSRTQYAKIRRRVSCNFRYRGDHHK